MQELWSPLSPSLHAKTDPCPHFLFRLPQATPSASSKTTTIAPIRGCLNPRDQYVEDIGAKGMGLHVMHAYRATVMRTVLLTIQYRASHRTIIGYSRKC